MRGAGGLILALLIVLLLLNAPINGLTLIQRIKAGQMEAGKYLQAKAAA